MLLCGVAFFVVILGYYFEGKRRKPKEIISKGKAAGEKKSHDEVAILRQVQETGEQLGISASGTRKGGDNYKGKEKRTMK